MSLQGELKLFACILRSRYIAFVGARLHLRASLDQVLEPLGIAKQQTVVDHARVILGERAQTFSGGCQNQIGVDGSGVVDGRAVGRLFRKKT